MDVRQRHVERRPASRSTAASGFDSFQPYYDEQGKAGDGPVSGRGHLPRIHVPSAERPRAARVASSTTCSAPDDTAIKVAYGRYSYNAGTMTNANSMMAGFVNPMAKTTKRYRWDGTLPFVPNPTNLISTTGGPNRSLDPNLELPYTDEFVAGIDQQVMSRHDGPLQLRAQARTQPDEGAEHRHPVFGLQHSRSSSPIAAATSRPPPTIARSRSTASIRAYLGPPGRLADQRSAEPVGLRDLQRRGRQAPLQPIAVADRLRHQPLRHVELCVGDRAGHRHRHAAACRRIPIG